MLHGVVDLLYLIRVSAKNFGPAPKLIPIGPSPGICGICGSFKDDKLSDPAIEGSWALNPSPLKEGLTPSVWNACPVDMLVFMPRDDATPEVDVGTLNAVGTLRPVSEVVDLVIAPRDKF